MFCKCKNNYECHFCSKKILQSQPAEFRSEIFFALLNFNLFSKLIIFSRVEQLERKRRSSSLTRVVVARPAAWWRGETLARAGRRTGISTPPEPPRYTLHIFQCQLNWKYKQILVLHAVFNFFCPVFIPLFHCSVHRFLSAKVLTEPPTEVLYSYICSFVSVFVKWMLVIYCAFWKVCCSLFTTASFVKLLYIISLSTIGLTV